MAIKSFKEFINENFGGFLKNINLDLKSKIEEWCKEMGINIYCNIVEDPKYGYIINLPDIIIRLNKKNLEYIPFKFKGSNKVKFDCSNNNLKSLENCPDECMEFNCSNNLNLKTLIGGPQKVIISYDCTNCDLRSLEGAPDSCFKFNCSNNLNLKTLKYGPQIVNVYKCKKCDLISLEGSPKECVSFDCSNNPNLKSLKNGPKIVKGLYNCSGCGLESLEGAPEECKIFDCSGNPCKFTEEEVRQYIKNVEKIIV